MTDRAPPGLKPEEIAHLAGRAKSVLRQRMRQLRKTMSAATIASKSLAIVEQLAALEVVQQASRVGLFWPIAGRSEVDLRELDRRLRDQGKRIYYPFARAVGGEFEEAVNTDAPGQQTFATGFAAVDDIEKLEIGTGLFAQPPSDVPAAARDELEVIIVPALAAAPDLGRIGYGVGYYDSTLPDYSPPAVTIIAVFDFQIIAEVPREPHDFVCDAVLTESRWFSRTIFAEAEPGQ